MEACIFTYENQKKYRKSIYYSYQRLQSNSSQKKQQICGGNMTYYAEYAITKKIAGKRCSITIVTALFESVDDLIDYLSNINVKKYKIIKE